MALVIGNLELYPGYETIGVRSNFTGEDEHTAILEFRRSGGAWIPGVDLERDTRENILNGDSSWKPNPYRYQNRGVVFFLGPNAVYDVRVRYYDANENYIGEQVESATTLDDDPPSTGMDYYVVPGGNDGADGSQSSPWRTIAHAVTQVQAGDTIWILPGVYGVGQVDINVSGVIDNYITIRGADPYNKPVVTGSSRGIFRIIHSSYIRIKDIDFRNTMSDHGICVALYGNCRGCIVEDHLMTIQGTGWWSSGVCMTHLDGACPTDTLVQRNQLTQQSASNGYGVLLNGESNSGVGCRGSLIRHNTLKGGTWDTIGGGGNFYEENGLCQDSHVHDNFVEGSRGDALELEGGGLNCSAWNNIISEQHGLFCIAVAAVVVGPMYVFRNIVDAQTVSNGCFKLGEYSDGQINIYHNTILARNAVLAAYGSPYDHDNVRTRNNIMWATGGNEYIIECGKVTGIHDDFDYDWAYSQRNTCIKWDNIIQRWSEFQASTGHETHGLFGQPVFVDQASGDYRLTEGSPGIDAGVILKVFNDENSPWAYQGGAPDIGAIESGVVGPPNASFIVDVDSGEVPLTVQFTNTTLGAVDSYLWDFGDGQSSTEVNPTHVFQNAGLFQVELVATGPGGNDSAIMNIDVIQTHVLTIIAGVGGTTNPEPGAHQKQGDVEIAALPDTDYRFLRWEEGGVELSTANPHIISMDVDRTITAVFEYIEPPPGEYIVTIMSLGEGYTVPYGEVAVPEGEELEIKATPLVGYKLDHWEGDVEGTNKVITFKVESNMSVVAVFSEQLLTPALLATSFALILSVGTIFYRGVKK